MQKVELYVLFLNIFIYFVRNSINRLSNVTKMSIWQNHLFTFELKKKTSVDKKKTSWHINNANILLVLTSLYSELFLPGFVDVVFFQDLDGDPCLTQKHILGQVFIVPQINSTKVENVYKGRTLRQRHVRYHKRY